MILSQSLGCLFIHIPKNAGTTVESLLAPHLDPGRDLHVSKIATLADNRAALGIAPSAKLEKHSVADRINAALPPGQWDGLFRFAFCRNPFARAWSCHNFTLQRAKADLRLALKDPAPAPKIARERANRADYARLSFDEVCENLGHLSTQHGLLRPQVTWLPGPLTADFVGRVEDLGADLAQLYGLIGLDPSALSNLPSLNAKTAPGDWRAMSPRAARAIADFYAADFARFGYVPDVMGPEGTRPRPLLRRPGRGADGQLVLEPADPAPNDSEKVRE